MLIGRTGCTKEEIQMFAMFTQRMDNSILGMQWELKKILISIHLQSSFPVGEHLLRIVCLTKKNHISVFCVLDEAHCSDLESISWTDSLELRASKERIFELVQQWIL